MAITDDERLQIVLSAKVDKLEKDMARGARAVDKNGRAMSAASAKSAKNMEESYASAGKNIASNLTAAFRSIVAGGAIVAAATAFKQVATSIAEVGREADKARVSTKVWQQWTFAAKATGATVGGVTDALKELNIRGDEFAVTGKGGAAEAFTRLGYSAADVAERLKDPSRFLDEIISKLQKMDKAAQARNLDELFGGSGAEEMSKMLGLSVSQIQKLRSEAELFSEEQIKSAAAIDATFEKIWRNSMVRMKRYIIDGAGLLDTFVKSQSNLIDGKGSNSPRDRMLRKALQDYSDKIKSPEYDDSKSNKLYLERKAIVEKIADLESKADFDIDIDGQTLDRLKSQLVSVDSEIESLAPHTKEFSAALSELSGMTNTLTGTLNNSAAASANFKQALTDLKNLVPELKAELDLLAQTGTIDAAFKTAANNARTMGELMGAVDIANRAKSAATYGSHKNLLDLIGAAEGTDKGRGYNETLGYGKFTGGNRNLTGMTLNEVMAMQGQMLAHPDNTFNSSAVGRYQITRQTLQDFMPRLGLASDHMFDEKTQDALAQAIAASTKGDADKLKGRWEGLRNVDATTIRNAYGNTQTVPDKLEPSDSQQQAIDLSEKQTGARKRLNDSLRESQSLAEIERATIGLSAQQREVELELFRRVQEAKRAGVNMSDQEIQAIRQQISATAQLRAETGQTQKSLEAVNTAKQFFAESFTQSLSGLITGTTSLGDAVKNLANSLMDAVLQATLLGKGPLAALFGFGGAGQSSGILGGILGFAEGGYTGRGGKRQAAGVVHRGEFVMSAAATRKIGVGNLERLHSSAKRGYAEGGFVGGTTFKRPANMNVPAAANTQPSFQISAPITVNGSAGTPEQNDDLAAKMAKQMEGTMRGIVNSELRLQSRPGNTLNKRSR